MTDTGLAITNFVVIVAAAILLQRFKRMSNPFVLIIYSSVLVVTAASVLHSLYAYYIIGASVAIYIGIAYVLKAPLLELGTKGRYDLFLIMSLCIPFFTFQVLQHFIGIQDARVTYLPMSRLLFESPCLQTEPFYEEVPSFSNYLGYPPALIGLCTVFYSIFGGVSAEIAGLVPSIFFVGFLLVLFKWCEDASVSPVTAAVLLLFSPILIEKCSWFCHEGPLLFSTTLLFYSIWKFSTEGAEKYLFYAMIGSCLALMFKYTGVFFALALIYYILQSGVLNRRLFILFFAIHLPCIIWYARNVYYFGSPVSPFLNALTSDPNLRSWLDAAWLVAHEEAHRQWHLLLFNILITPVSLPVLVIWAIAFPFTSLRENKVYFLSFILFCALLPLWIGFNTDIRYLVPFYGIALVQFSTVLEDFCRRRQLSLGIYLGPAGRIMLFVSSIFIVLCLQFIYVERILPDRISPGMAAVNLLENNEDAKKDTRIFTDTDHVILWKTRWAVFDPTVPKLAPDFLEARKTQDYFGLMVKYNIKYVVNHPWVSPWEESVFSIIEKDTKHFARMPDAGGAKIWKVQY